MPELIRHNDIFEITSHHLDAVDRLKVTAIATGAGVLPYLNPDGTIRYELRDFKDIYARNDAGMPFIASLANIPVTNEHPPEFLKNNPNANQYVKGKTDSRIKVFDNGQAQIEFELTDPELIRLVQDGEKRGVSPGYACATIKQDGVWKGIVYTHRQLPGHEYDHLAVCKYPRFDAALIKSTRRSDSLSFYQVDSQLLKKDSKQMSETFTLHFDSKPYPVNADLYQAITKERSDHADLLKAETAKTKAAEAKADTLEAKVKELESKPGPKADSQLLTIWAEVQDALDPLVKKGDLKLDGVDSNALKAAYIKQRSPGLAEKVDGYTPEQIDVAYELLKVSSQHTDTRGNLPPSNPKPSDYQQVRTDSMKEDLKTSQTSLKELLPQYK